MNGCGRQFFLSRSGTRQISGMLSHKRSQTFIEMSLSRGRKSACIQINVFNVKFRINILKAKVTLFQNLWLQKVEVYCWKNQHWGLQHNVSGLSSVTNTTSIFIHIALKSKAVVVSDALYGT